MILDFILKEPLLPNYCLVVISMVDTSSQCKIKVISTISLTFSVFSCRDNHFDYLEFRLWIGLWSAFFCLVLVATDASFLVQYFTRFTEEGFSCLISFIFIYDAFKKMLKLAHHYPINSEYKTDYITQYECLCMAPTVLGKTPLLSTGSSGFSVPLNLQASFKIVQNRSRAER